MVRFQIQYKPIHPVTNAGVTNLTLETWNGSVSNMGSVNPNYDMLLMYVRTDSQSQLSTGHFVRVPSETWAVYSESDSIKGAMAIAKPLIKQYGISNVQICKIAPCDLEIVFEE